MWVDYRGPPLSPCISTVNNTSSELHSQVTEIKQYTPFGGSVATTFKAGKCTGFPQTIPSHRDCNSCVLAVHMFLQTQEVAKVTVSSVIEMSSINNKHCFLIS